MLGAQAATREATDARPCALRASFARGCEPREEEGRRNGGMPILLCRFGFSTTAAAAAWTTTLALPPSLARPLSAARCSLCADVDESSRDATAREAWSEMKASAPATAAAPWRRTSAARSLAPACVEASAAAACAERDAARAIEVVCFMR